MSDSGTEAFLWSPGLGMVGLGDLAGGEFRSRAIDISADGMTVVGDASSEAGTEAFRWTSLEGMVGLGIPSGSDRSYGLGVSADGSVVVGYHEGSASASSAFVWDATHGMRDLQAVLTDLGVDLTGWTLQRATGVSDDGWVIVGTGTNPNEDPEAWLAVLPEPGSSVPGLGALATLAITRARGVSRRNAARGAAGGP